MGGCCVASREDSKTLLAETKQGSPKNVLTQGENKNSARSSTKLDESIFEFGGTTDRSGYDAEPTDTGDKQKNKPIDRESLNSVQMSAKTIDLDQSDEESGHFTPF